MRFLKTISATFIGLSLSIATLAPSPSWAADEISFKSYKAASEIGEDFVIERERCTSEACFWRTAKVLNDLRYLLFELGHERAGKYPTIDTTNLMHWVVHEAGPDIHFAIGKVTAVDVEHFKPTDERTCPFEAQVKYQIQIKFQDSNSGPSNPITEILGQIFEADNQATSDEELNITKLECYKHDAGEWKRTKWGYYLRKS